MIYILVLLLLRALLIVGGVILVCSIYFCGLQASMVALCFYLAGFGFIAAADELAPI